MKTLILRVCALAACWLLSGQANAILVSGDPNSQLPYQWTNAQGSFASTRDDWLGGGAYGAAIAYDYDSQLFTATSTGLNPFRGTFALSALVERDTGKLLSGGYALLAGELGIPELSVDPFSLLLAGTVIDKANLPVDIPEYPESTRYTTLGVALLEVGYISPVLNSSDTGTNIASYNYLTFDPRTSRLFPSNVSPWSISWSSRSGGEGYELLGTLKVIEPSFWALLCAGALLLPITRRRRVEK